MKRKIQIISIGFIILSLQLITHNSFSQNVGINTDGSTPESGTMLDIKSAGTTSATFGLKVKDSDGDEKVVVRSDGNVGIGTSVPGYRLEINKPTALTSNQLDISLIKATSTGNMTDGFGSAIKFGIEDDAGVENPIVSLNAQRNGADNSGTFAIWTNNAGTWGTKMTILPNGNTGIGITSPLKKFEVLSSDFDIAEFRRSGAGGAGIALVNASAEEWSLGAGSDGNFYLFETATGTSTRLFVERTSGHVGLGTINPNKHLEIAAAGGTTEMSLKRTDANSTGRIGSIEFINNGNTILSEIRGVGSGSNTDSDIAFLTKTSAGSLTEQMRILDNGNVGIGTTNPSVKLDVNGSVNCTGGSCSSDIRWKKDIKPLQDVLSKIKQLRGVNYYWKQEEFVNKNFTTEKQLGVIAQEVEKVYPELVLTNRDGYKSMDYMSFSAVLLEAIKEQQQIIEDQKLKIANQDARFASLEKRIIEKDKQMELRMNRLEEILKTVSK